MVQAKSYEVIVTKSAEQNYQSIVLEYLVEYFSIDRAMEIDKSISSLVLSLSLAPHRGAEEKYLRHLKKKFRFILYKESRNFEIKIIYHVEEEKGVVYVTDFFPTLMNPARLYTKTK